MCISYMLPFWLDFSETFLRATFKWPQHIQGLLLHRRLYQ